MPPPPTARLSEAQRLRAWFLDHNKRLRALPDHITRALFSMGTVERYPAGKVVCEVDEVMQGAWGVVEGSVSSRRAADGRMRTLREYGPGDLFGLQGLLDGARAPAEIVVDMPTRLVRFDPLRLGELRASYHPLGQALLAGLLPLLVEEHVSLIRRTIEIQRARAHAA
jgi:CRP-like cAMP-binding protein